MCHLARGSVQARSPAPETATAATDHHPDDSQMAAGGLFVVGGVGRRRCRRKPLNGLSPLVLARTTSPLSGPPPRSTRFGSPLVLLRVHWVEPKLVAEITYLTWMADNLLRHTVYVGLREDKPAMEVRREAARAR